MGAEEEPHRGSFLPANLVNCLYTSCLGTTDWKKKHFMDLISLATLSSRSLSNDFTRYMKQ